MGIPVTGIPLIDFALGLLARHAYLITFAVALLECVFVVGSFTPGETTLLAAGFAASLSPSDHISPAPLIAVAVLGGVIGSNVSYFIGRRGGRPVLSRFGERIERRIHDAEGYFQRRGSLTVVLARFAPGIKNFAFTIAGVSRMPVTLFEIYGVLGAIVYAATTILLGYFFGSNFNKLLKAVHGVGYGALALLVVFGAWTLGHRYLTKRRRRNDLAAFGEPGKEQDGDE